MPTELLRLSPGGAILTTVTFLPNGQTVEIVTRETDAKFARRDTKPIAEARNEYRRLIREGYVR